MSLFLPLAAFALCASTTAAAADESNTPLAAWEFNDPAFSLEGAYNIALRVEDGVLHGAATDTGGGSYLFLPPVDVPTPVRVAFRALTPDTMTDLGEMYWVTEESPGYAMDKRIQFPVHHDGAWRDYSIPLPATGRLRQVRLSLGRGSGDIALDDVRILADPLPRAIVDQIAALPEEVTIADEALHVSLHCREHVYRVTDRRTGRQWSTPAAPIKALLTRVEKQSDDALRLALYDHSTRTTFSCVVSLPAPGALTFAMDGDAAAPLHALDTYPPMLTADFAKGKLVFCDRSCGVFADQDDATYGGRLLEVYGNTSCTDMPWIGAIDTARGDGVMTLLETPADAFFMLAPDGRGAHWPQVIWRPSMDAFGYGRRLSYRFASDGGYVRMAEQYRAYAEGLGLIRPLKDRIADNPAIALLPGAPPLWGATDAYQFVQEARTYGILRGVLSNASHGLRDPATIPLLNEMGYLTSTYDNFSDIVDGPTGYGRDDVAAASVVPRPGQGPKHGWAAYEHQMYERSSALALRALRQYVPEDVAKYGYNGRFVDVSMAMSLHEDYHPNHTLSRRADMAHRREAFAYLDGLGLVLGTEHGNDWGADLVAYREGSMSGPFWWTGGGTWNAGMLTRPTSRDDYTPEYLTFGHGYDTRVPLWELVYHDCQGSTWYWGDSPGFHYAVAPEIAERKDLFNLLYGTVPLLWRDTTDYDWNVNRDRFVRTYHMSTRFNRAVAFSRMTDHAFLTDDASVQRTTFDSGHTVVVNFGDTPCPWRTAAGDEVTLAPQGFCAEGPGFHQSRTLVDGDPVWRIETEDFRLCETAQRRRIGPVETAGLFYAFRRDDGVWQAVLDRDATCALDARALTGWAPAQRIAVVALDPLSRDRAVLAVSTADEPVTLTARGEDRFFALMPVERDRTILHPPSGWLSVDDAVTLSCTDPAATTRYTLDGSEPTNDSPRYAEPFTMQHSGRVRARSFRDGAPVGEEVAADYRVVRTLFASEVMRGGDAPVRVDVPVAGYAELRIVVTHGGDDCWSDRANLAEAAFVRDDGAAIHLADREPAYHRQTYGELRRDANALGGPLAIAGTTYTHGIGLQSEAELRYAIAPGDARFRAWVGVDDSANPSDPEAPASHIGTVAFIVQGVLPEGPDPERN